MGFRAALTFQKFKVALNPIYRIFFNFAKCCILSYVSKFDDNKGFYRGNLLCHENDNNVFTNGQFPIKIYVLESAENYFEPL